MHALVPKIGTQIVVPMRKQHSGAAILDEQGPSGGEFREIVLHVTAVLALGAKQYYVHGLAQTRDPQEPQKPRFDLLHFQAKIVLHLKLGIAMNHELAGPFLDRPARLGSLNGGNVFAHEYKQSEVDERAVEIMHADGPWVSIVI